MIEGPYAKVGVAGILIGGIWAMSMAVERMGGNQVTRRGAREGALVPEMAVELPPIRPDAPNKHTALVAVSVPKVQSIDPGSVRISTPGIDLEDARIHPIVETRKPTNPKPRSILLLLDNSRSMVVSGNGFAPSDPEYRRLDACRLLLESLSEKTDKVSLACFPCRISVMNQENINKAIRPFEILAPWGAPVMATDGVDSLRAEENGSTPLYRAVAEGARMLAKSPAGNQRIMVLLTDGRDTDQFADGLKEAVSELQTSKADVYAIGLGPAADVDVLKRMSNHVLLANDAKALNRTFRQISLQMSREVTQVDLDVIVSRVGSPIPAGQPVEITFRSNGKLYTTHGKTQP